MGTVISIASPSQELFSTQPPSSLLLCPTSESAFYDRVARLALSPPGQASMRSFRLPWGQHTAL